MVRRIPFGLFGFQHTEVALIRCRAQDFARTGGNNNVIEVKPVGFLLIGRIPYTTGRMINERRVDRTRVSYQPVMAIATFDVFVSMLAPHSSFADGCVKVPHNDRW